ncbi:MAG: hypothetical protein AAGB51_10080 [Planctomycetota bacterium]
MVHGSFFGSPGANISVSRGIADRSAARPAAPPPFDVALALQEVGNGIAVPTNPFGDPVPLTALLQGLGSQFEILTIGTGFRDLVRFRMSPLETSFDTTLQAGGDAAFGVDLITSAGAELTLADPSGWTLQGVFFHPTTDNGVVIDMDFIEAIPAPPPPGTEPSAPAGFGSPPH